MRSSGWLLSLVVLGACGGDPTAAGPDAATVDATGEARPVVVLSTSKGDLVVRLEPGEMPITTANFLSYVDSGWYDGTLVHRVVADWVIQGGGFKTGLVPKATMPAIQLETSPNVPHVHGAISMARSNNPNSATSQWFIVDWPQGGDGPQRQLDGDYAAFGNLIEGFDVLAAISAVPTHTAGGLEDVPVTEVVVTHAARR